MEVEFGYSCCGFGQRVLLMDIEKPLREVLELLVKEHGVTVFYTGRMGEFDASFGRNVKALKRDDPSLQLVLVMPYLTNRLNADKSYYETLYDEILIPAELDGIHPKKAIGLRNRWMVDHSVFVVAALHRNYGGAADAIRYVRAMNRKVFQIGYGY